MLEEGGKRILEIQSVSPFGGRHLRVRFKGIEKREQAQNLKGRKLFVEESSLPPCEGGEFYFFELEGSRIELEDGTPVGELLWIEKLRNQELFHIKTKEGGELLLPVVSEFVLKIIKEEKRIIVRIPEGLK